MKCSERVICFLLVALLPGCRTQTSIPTLTMPEPSLSVAAPQLRPADATVVLNSRASRWTPERIDAVDFFPDDAGQRLEPRSMPRDVRRIATRYPSEEECRSPQWSHVLRCHTKEERGERTHTLMLKRGPQGEWTTIWVTQHPFDVIWSWEGDAVAISQRRDDGRADVWVYLLLYNRVYSLPNLFPVELESMLAPAQFRARWDFRVVGWAPYHRLIVRGVGRDEQAPYQDYGHEFMVDFMKGSDPRYPGTLLRAYRRESIESHPVQ